MKILKNIYKRFDGNKSILFSIIIWLVEKFFVGAPVWIKIILILLLIISIIDHIRKGYFSKNKGG